MTTGRYLVSCRHCLRPIMLVEYVRDVDLGRLRQHLRDHGTGKPPPDAAETLQHFRLESEPEPPDAA